MEKISVCGLGNAIVDIVVEISEEEFQELNLKKGTMELVDTDFQQSLLKKFESHGASLASGGSVANSIIAVAELGGKAGLLTSFGDDKYGLHYHSEFEQWGIALGSSPKVNGVTGTSVVLVTPDAERTMRTNLGTCPITVDSVNKEIISRSEWLFLEGYIFANPDQGVAANLKAIEYAKESGCKIALTCSDTWILENFGDSIREVASDVSLIIANEDEAKVYTSTDSLEDAFAALCETFPNVAMTAGPKGAKIKWEGKTYEVSAVPTEPRDLTGAGDVFAGSFLYGVTHGIAPDVAARKGCFLAHKVISQIGARLLTGVKDYWEEG